MSSSNTALGPDARVFVNTIAFAVIEGRYTDMADVSETTDSLSKGAKEAAAGNRQFTCDITMQRISGTVAIVPNGGIAQQMNIYNAPLNVFPGSFINLRLNLDGNFAGLTPTFLIPFFLIEELEGNWRVQGSEPQTIRFRGRSVGYYATPDSSSISTGVPAGIRSQSNT
jgi:hypothetical protein